MLLTSSQNLARLNTGRVTNSVTPQSPRGESSFVKECGSPRFFSRPKTDQVPASPGKELLVLTDPPGKELLVQKGLTQHPRKWGLGEPKGPQRSGKESELTKTLFKTWTKNSPLKLDPNRLYVFVIDDERGVTYAPVDAPDGDPVKGVTHYMIAPDDMNALIGGEMSQIDGHLFFSTQSATYSQGVTPAERERVAELLRELPKSPDYRTPFSVVFTKHVPK